MQQNSSNGLNVDYLTIDIRMLHAYLHSDSEAPGRIPLYSEIYSSNSSERVDFIVGIINKVLASSRDKQRLRELVRDLEFEF